ncbi:SGNH hydrolase-type esterase domain-containing protein [Kockovaella imperatae]|uniref:SGNH hydrolase-type esterase domain-containing protein n=1 Tax=Kockovaella imperatae TaxID=4999 RepID=A0A1Y1UMH5_9TREE|nr:SGNH hydrolase-type esterase domain-containing protein [Kockovaella imperatae]ORX38694.1 SGNH hydrolase-type esterase domain-containing protein [Kockovaella imperatae]
MPRRSGSDFFSSGPFNLTGLALAVMGPNATGYAVGSDQTFTSSLVRVSINGHPYSVPDPREIGWTDPIDFAITAGLNVPLVLDDMETSRGISNGQTTWFAKGDQTFLGELDQGIEELGTYFLSGPTFYVPYNMRLFSLFGVASTSVLAAVLPERDADRWVDLWTVAPFIIDGPSGVPSPYNDTSGGVLANTTIRQTVRPSHDASEIKFQLSNFFSTGPLVIQHLSVAHALPNASGVSLGQGLIDVPTSKDITFDGGQSGITIQPGDIIETDPVDFRVIQDRDYSLSMFLGQGQSHNITGHFWGETAWFLGGDQTSAPNFSQNGGAEQIGTYFLAAIEGKVNAEAIVALGDSTTDRAGTDIDTYVGWTDDLAVRIQNDPSTRHLTVNNAGIGANTVFHLPSVGEPAVDRLQRDVLNQAGVKYCIVFEGVNDIGSQNDTEIEGPTSPSTILNGVIDGYKSIIERLHAQGIKAIGATITPFHKPAYATGLNFYYTPGREQTRLKINEWIRTPGNYDAFFDFSAVVTNASNPIQMADRYASADFLHPGPEGYKAIAESIDLNVFH